MELGAFSISLTVKNLDKSKAFYEKIGFEVFAGDQSCNKQESFTDVRTLHQRFKSDGVDIVSESIENESGPSSFSILDPDGNLILIDQHV
ncbi:MAG: glyoxalase [Planctomycetota bacterium]|nr:MAG: glyoxalase [Planctomycetota bacterium]